jgi:benzoate membrane transport protein
MLAGVLMALCLAPAKAVTVSPGPALTIITVWFVVLMARRLYAVPAAVAATLAIIIWKMPPGAFDQTDILARSVLITPSFSMAGVLGTSLPLFPVTMASQNLPGIAVLQAHG